MGLCVCDQKVVGSNPVARGMIFAIEPSSKAFNHLYFASR